MRPDPLRGTGRTLAMVRRLRAGAVVIVPHATLRSYVKDMIFRAHGRAMVESVRVLVIGTPADVTRLYGLNCQVEVDHSFHELARFDVRAAVDAILDRYRDRAVA